MAVPKAYENYNISMPAIRLGQFTLDSERKIAVCRDDKILFLIKG